MGSSLFGWLFSGQEAEIPGSVPSEPHTATTATAATEHVGHPAGPDAADVGSLEQEGGGGASEAATGAGEAAAYHDAVQDIDGSQWRPRR